MKSKLCLGFYVLALAVLVAPIPALAQEAPPDVMEVIVIDPSGADDPYTELHDKFTALYKAHNSKIVRELWFSGYAGPQTGRLVVTIRYPNIAAFAASNELLQTEEYLALVQQFQEKGFVVASRSLTFRNR